MTKTEFSRTANTKQKRQLKKARYALNAYLREIERDEQMRESNATQKELKDQLKNIRYCDRRQKAERETLMVFCDLTRIEAQDLID